MVCTLLKDIEDPGGKKVAYVSAYILCSFKFLPPPPGLAFLAASLSFDGTNK